MSGTLIAVCRLGQTHHGLGKDGATGIDKRPLPGPVAIEHGGVAGDRQYSPQHGGEYQAIYAYDRAEAQRWAAELGREIPAGTFGENFAVAGIQVTDAVIGERWLVGGEHGVLLMVTAPRIPCKIFQAWMGEPQWVKRFTAQGDVGAYLRVLRPGTVRAGDPIEVLDRPAHGVTAREVFNAAARGGQIAGAAGGSRTAGTDHSRLRRLLDEGEQLSPKLIARLNKLLDAPTSPQT
jgi:MOSC domain-containing protein YiiM